MKTLTSLDRCNRPRARPAAPPAATPTAILPDLSAAAMRRDLRDKGVQIIPIGTVPEQMLFDVRWFVVEAGKPVQVVLTNPDTMPHNIVIGRPGSVTAIGAAAATMTPPADPNAPAYVPDSPLVLEATGWSTAASPPPSSSRRRHTRLVRFRLFVPRTLHADVRRHARRAEPRHVRGETRWCRTIP